MITDTKIGQVETKAAILERVKSGKSYREIAKELDIGKTTVGKLYNEAICEVRDSNLYETEKLRTKELLCLDELQAGVWTLACSGDVNAIEAVLKIMKQRASITGLNAAIKIELDQLPLDSLSDEAINRLLSAKPNEFDGMLYALYSGQPEGSITAN